MKTPFPNQIAMKWLVGAVALMTCFGCSRTEPTAKPAEQELSIAAAANLKYALDALVAQFRHHHPNVEVTVTYGASGNLFAQISQHARFDVFLSADMTYPQRLVDAGLAESDSLFHYANGRLVLWTMKDSKIDWNRAGLDCLLEPPVRKISIPNPKVAPYGKAAEECLRKQGIWERVLDKLVLGENINQALQFVDSGGAEIGFNALSMVIVPEMSSHGRYWEVPFDRYQPIRQAGVVLRSGRNGKVAQEWREFMMGNEGQEVLSKFGYGAPDL